MQDNPRTVYFVIPALNEEKAIGKVIKDIPVSFSNDLRTRIIVVNNGSTDNTSGVARSAGAMVVDEPKKGYGAACLKGVASVGADCFALIFIDADYSDYPEEAEMLLRPIVTNEADLVIGSRTLKKLAAGALMPQQRLGNWLAVSLIRLFWRHKYTDLGPFRAIRYSSYQKLCMADQNFGWTIEMQIKAVQSGLRILEVPVSYRKRIGKSKISGTIKGTIRAGIIIIVTIFRLRHTG